MIVAIKMKTADIVKKVLLLKRFIAIKKIEYPRAIYRYILKYYV